MTLNNLLAVVVAGVACVIPVGYSRADTIFVDCPTDGTIRQFNTNGVGTIFARQSIANPQAEAFDKAGNLYIANGGFGIDTIEKFTTNGVPSVFAADPGDNSVLDYAAGLAFDKAGNLYVANEGNNTIEKFDTNGVASVFAADDGSDTILNGPEGLAFDSAGNLYAANDGNFIEEFSATGENLGNYGDSSYLNSPVGIAFDTAGNLYVANSEPAEDGPTIAKFTSSVSGSVFASNGLDDPEFMAFDTNGNLYVSNSGNSNNVEKFDTHGNGSVLIDSALDGPFGLAFDSAEHLYVANDGGYGNFIQEFDTNGNNLLRFASPSLSDPQQMVFDSKGNLYVANYSFGTVEKFDTNAVASIFAFAGNPVGLAVDGSDNLYVTASYANQIMKFAPNGSGSVFATDDGSGLILNNPQDLAFDTLGNLYTINDNVNSLSKFDSSGHSSVFAGYTDFYTHGPGLAVDSANNVYVLTNSTEIAKFSPGGGVPVPFANVPGASSYYANVEGMAFDSAGNLYEANYYDGTIEKFDTNGNGTIFASGLAYPTDVAILRSSAIVFIPTLTISKTGTNVVLSWSTAATGYNLQSTTNLVHPNWQTVSGTISTNGVSLMQTNGISSSVRFFRLSNP